MGMEWRFSLISLLLFGVHHGGDHRGGKKVLRFFACVVVFTLSLFFTTATVAYLAGRQARRGAFFPHLIIDQGIAAGEGLVFGFAQRRMDGWMDSSGVGQRGLGQTNKDCWLRVFLICVVLCAVFWFCN